MNGSIQRDGCEYWNALLSSLMDLKFGHQWHVTWAKLSKIWGSNRAINGRAIDAIPDDFRGFPVLWRKFVSSWGELLKSSLRYRLDFNPIKRRFVRKSSCAKISFRSSVLDLYSLKNTVSTLNYLRWSVKL